MNIRYGWMLLAFFLMPFADASSVTIDSDKILNLSGQRTFPTILYNICSQSTNWFPHTSNCVLDNKSMWVVDATNLNLPDSDWFTNALPRYAGNDTYWLFKNSDDSGGGHTQLYPTAGQKADPRLLGYIQTDEPSGSGSHTVADLENSYADTVADDPNHPVILNHWHDFHTWDSACDICMFDYYTHGSGTGINWDEDEFLYAYDLYMNAAFFHDLKPSQSSKPVWLILQAYGTTVHPQAGQDLTVLSEVDVRGLTYTAISADIQGIGYYDFQDGTVGDGLSANSTEYSYYENMAEEIRDLNDVLIMPTVGYSWYGEQDNSTVSIYPNPTNDIEGFSVPKFSYILKDDPDSNDYYLIVVNKGSSQSALTVLSINALSGSGSYGVITLGLAPSGSGVANRELIAYNGVISDTFDPFTAHVYRFIDPSPASTPTSTPTLPVPTYPGYTPPDYPRPPVPTVPGGWGMSGVSEDSEFKIFGGDSFWLIALFIIVIAVRFKGFRL